ncbi:MAG: hypothetical protein J2P48_10630 [Alphaproteobacteria bacterium]|nr:hypothetical protein [Alphaproteobacteria bacterium]
MKRQLHLNLFIHGRGRHPASPLALTDIGYYQDRAPRTPPALLDAIVAAGRLALIEDVP